MDEFIRKNDVYNLKNAFDALVKKEIKRNSVENIIFAKAMETTFNMIEQAVREVPAADVVEVVHAKWEFNGICTSCSACGSNKPTKAHDHKLASREVRFCYFCGAKMDLEESK